jgi:oligopeptidase B
MAADPLGTDGRTDPDERTDADEHGDGGPLFPPLAPRRPHQLETHGDLRVDDWYWLADREDPEVIGYLEAENAYTEQIMAPLADLQDRLFEGIKGRIAETDVSAPARSGPWWYWSGTVEGQQYGILSRLADPDRQLTASDVLRQAQLGGPDVQVVLDENVLADGHDFFGLGVFDISPDHRRLAYAVDVDGGEEYLLRFRDLDTGEDLADVIEGVNYGSAWARDNETFFYTRTDDAHRPHQIWRHRLGQDPSTDVLVFEDPDERFNVSVELTRTERFVVIGSESKTTSEYLALDADRPASVPVTVLPRRAGVEYDIEHAVLPGMGDVWLVRTNAPGTDGAASDNFAVRILPIGGGWDDVADLVAHRPEIKVESVLAFVGHVVISERANGLENLRVLTLRTDTDEAGAGDPAAPVSAGVVADEHTVAQPDPVYSLGGGANAEFDSAVLRFGYTSMVAPMSSIDYHLDHRTRDVVRVQPVLGGYRPEDYRTERIWATAPDGTQIPISLVAPKHQPTDGSAPCLLYGYGSYEITIDPTFSAARLNLLERGFTFAIAHIRGGGELGRSWYEEGKLGRKRNTFTDFIACAEHLIATGWTRPDRLVARGGSAGGLLMGAVTNFRPDLWRAIVAEVPFVDVVTTMSDTSLPLTVTEWEEWGNPIDDPEAYAYMRSYSPYDNVESVDHPAMYITGGLNDPRVGYWEPAKWVAKLRVLSTGSQPIVLRTELGAGHQGPSGRYDAWRDEARVQSFVLSNVGITE